MLSAERASFLEADNVRLAGENREKDAMIAGLAARMTDLAKAMADRLGEKDAQIAEIKKAMAERLGEDARIAELEAAVAKLGASDAYHNGPNSPSSSGSMSSRKRAKEEADRRAKNGIKKPGRKKGHAGVTRKIKADKTVHHRPERCNRCGSADLHETTVTSKQTVEVVEIVVEETNHVMHDCRCLNCGADIEAPRAGLVEGTSMGPVLSSFVACLLQHGVSLGGIQGVLTEFLKVKTGRTAVYNTAKAVANALAEEHDKIVEQASERCEGGGKDETTFGHTYRNEPVSDAPDREPPEKPRPRCPAAREPPAPVRPQAGKPRPPRPADLIPHDRALPARTAPPDPVGGCTERRQVYAWGLVTLTLVVVRLASSRGGAVFEEHFEYRIRAANTTDGYVVYDVILVRQRCFAHILRDAKQLSWSKEKTDAELHRRLLGLYYKAKSLTNPGGALADPRARENYAMLVSAAKELAGDYKKAGREKFGGKLERAADHLFTFILHPGLDPTNNECERVMKSIVKQRNVRQKCATAGGRARFGVLMTCFETWKKRGLSTTDRLGEILGVPPAPEYAQIRAAGSRACLGGT